MTTAFVDANGSDVSANDYLVVGLATCYIREEGEMREVKVVEPIPSSALEALFKGIPTSYSLACATTLGAVVTGDGVQKPTEFPETVEFCEDFAQRAIAVTRTYKSRPSAQELIPQGTTKADFNFSTERRRVLNALNEVRTEDNVKQHEYTHKVL